MKILGQIIARLIFWPVLLAGMFFAVFNIAAHTMLDDNTLRTLTAYGLSETLKGQVDLSWAKLSPTGKIRIKNLRLRDKEKLSENMIKADNVFMQINPLSLFTGTLEIKELTFIAPRLELVKEKDNTWNLQHFASNYNNNKSASHFNAIINSTVIRDGEIQVLNRIDGNRHEFRNINMSMQNFSPNADTPFEASSSFTAQGRKKPFDGRFFTRGNFNLANFDFSKAELKNLNGNLVLQNIEIPFSGSLTNLTAPTIKIKAATSKFHSSSMDYMFESPVEFSAPQQDWNLTLNYSDNKIIAEADTDPLDIKIAGNISISTSAAYKFQISAPPLPLEDINRHIGLIVQNPRGQIKPIINIISNKDGSPKLTDFSADFSNSNFKYKTLTATGLDMLVNLTENFENSNVTIYDGRLQLGTQRLTTLVLKGDISKKELSMNFSGRLNSDPTKGKMAIMNPFSRAKRVYYTGYSENLQYGTAKTLIFDLISLLSDKTKKEKRFSQLEWVNQLRNSIPSGYSLFSIAYKAGLFRHEYLQAKNFYATTNINSMSGKIENLTGKLSIKTGAGTLFKVEENSKKDRIHYLASMPLRFIDELNKKKAFKFEKLEDVQFKAMGGDISANKGIAVIENFYMEGDEFSACLNGDIDFINETVNLRIYTIMDKYSRGVLPAGLTDKSGKSAMAFSLSGKMDNPVLNMLSPKDAAQIIAEAVAKEPAVNFVKIRRLLGGN